MKYRRPVIKFSIAFTWHCTTLALNIAKFRQISNEEMNVLLKLTPS